MKMEKEIKQTERQYYIGLEYQRVFGKDIEHLEEKLSLLLQCEINFIFLEESLKLIHNLFGRGLSATEVYSSLEALTDEKIEVVKQPESNEVVFYTKIQYFNIELTLHLGSNQRCWYEEVGTQEVPVYELKCEED